MFSVTFTNGTDDLELFFKLRNTPVAKKWYDELRKDYELYETDRLEHWGKDKLHFIKELNQQIDIINEYEFIIDRKVTENINQQELNYLHKFFEDLRGEVTTKTKWYIEAPLNVQEAVTRFNVEIHQLERALETENSDYLTATVTFKDANRIELAEEDLRHFTYRWKRGTVYINYCHVGKPVLDVFSDKDEIAEAIRPQTHYSADFMIKFGPSVKLILYWIKKAIVANWLRKRKFNIKHLNLGMIPVADWINNVDKKELLKYDRIKSVKCIN